MTYDEERARQAPARKPPPARRDPRGAPAPRTAPREAPPRPPADAPPPASPTNPVAPVVHVALLAQTDRDRLTLHLQHALGAFVQSPQQAVQEADITLAEATTRVTAALVERRRAIGATHRGHGVEAETEDLRLALREYREITLRLLRM
ncbi:hypothetical protein [Streptomyces sp. NBC_00347]|uniref:hypothetical protein n=1 Tax=Streptomyces sp. NBC_00347 TaxID=2975721 RepID=UPI0022585C86|nr:hypothetical protein [Streptomyces sp. NBC_00347]MCX5125630.1 hypothetical protein [Streptomyces sp. NBC_00347]